MAVEKPTFPTITPKQLQGGFDELANTMEDVRQKNGKVNVKKLAKAVAASDNKAMKLAFEVIKDEYKVEKRVYTSGGCGGGYWRTTTVTPNKLEPADVDTVMEALIKARKKAGRLDKDGNKVVDAQEAKSINRLRGLSGHMVAAAVRGEVKEYVDALRNWQWTLRTTADTMDERQYREDTIDELASFHCKYKNGARALAWALRAVATNGDVSLWNMEHDVKRMAATAETSETSNPLLRYFDGTMDNHHRINLSEGHLDNHEVRAILGETDLAAFEKQMKKVVFQQTGLSYSDYLAGKDLAGVDQLDDPDRNKTPGFEPANDHC